MAGTLVVLLLLVLLFVAVRPRRRTVPPQPKPREGHIPGVKVTFSVGRSLNVRRWLVGTRRP